MYLTKYYRYLKLYAVLQIIQQRQQKGPIVFKNDPFALIKISMGENTDIFENRLVFRRANLISKLNFMS